MISYDFLWKTMDEKKVSKYDLMSEYNISSSTLKRLKNNESVSVHTLELLCEALKCPLTKILQFV